MFGLFRSAPFSDPALGELVRSRGLWRGTVHLDSRATPIAVAGTRSAPDPVALAFVSVLPMNGTTVTELGYATAWDEEHTPGVRFADGEFVELCASVLPP